MIGALASRLATWRAAAALDDDTSIILFGVGLSTLERIEAGEIEPSPEIVARIERELELCGLPRSPLEHGGGPTGVGAAQPRGPGANFNAVNRGRSRGSPSQSNRGLL